MNEIEKLKLEIEKTTVHTNSSMRSMIDGKELEKMAKHLDKKVD